MSSSHHQHSRSKTSHKNRIKENELQHLYRQNKSAFPEQMEERDILHTLEVNKVTQKNIGSFLGKLLNGELRLETAWSDVGSKKKKKEARPPVKDARRHGGNDRANRDDRGNRRETVIKIVQKILPKSSNINNGNYKTSVPTGRLSSTSRRSGKKTETNTTGGSLNFAQLIKSSGNSSNNGSRGSSSKYIKNDPPKPRQTSSATTNVKEMDNSRNENSISDIPDMKSGSANRTNGKALQSSNADKPNKAAMNGNGTKPVWGGSKSNHIIQLMHIKKWIAKRQLYRISNKRMVYEAQIV